MTSVAASQTTSPSFTVLHRVCVYEATLARDRDSSDDHDDDQTRAMYATDTNEAAARATLQPLLAFHAPDGACVLGSSPHNDDGGDGAYAREPLHTLLQCHTGSLLARQRRCRRSCPRHGISNDDARRVTTAQHTGVHHGSSSSCCCRGNVRSSSGSSGASGSVSAWALLPVAEEGVYLQLPSPAFVHHCHRMRNNNNNNGSDILSAYRDVVYYNSTRTRQQQQRQHDATSSSSTGAVLNDEGYVYGYAFVLYGDNANDACGAGAARALVLCLLATSPSFHFMRALTLRVLPVLARVCASRDGAAATTTAADVAETLLAGLAALRALTQVHSPHSHTCPGLPLPPLLPHTPSTAAWQLRRSADLLYAHSDTPLSLLISSFSYAALRVLQTLLLQERRVVLVGASAQHASACVVSAPALLSPLCWCAPLIAHLPTYAAVTSGMLDALLQLPMCSIGRRHSSSNSSNNNNSSAASPPAETRGFLVGVTADAVPPLLLRLCSMHATLRSAAASSSALRSRDNSNNNKSSNTHDNDGGSGGADVDEDDEEAHAVWVADARNGHIGVVTRDELCRLARNSSARATAMAVGRSSWQWQRRRDGAWCVRVVTRNAHGDGGGDDDDDAAVHLARTVNALVQQQQQAQTQQQQRGQVLALMPRSRKLEAVLKVAVTREQRLAFRALLDRVVRRQHDVRQLMDAREEAAARVRARCRASHSVTAAHAGNNDNDDSASSSFAVTEHDSSGAASAVSAHRRHMQQQQQQQQHEHNDNSEDASELVTATADAMSGAYGATDADDDDDSGDDSDDSDDSDDDDIDDNGDVTTATPPILSPQQLCLSTTTKTTTAAAASSDDNNNNIVMDKDDDATAPLCVVDELASVTRVHAALLTYNTAMLFADYRAALRRTPYDNNNTSSLSGSSLAVVAASWLTTSLALRLRFLSWLLRNSAARRVSDAVLQRIAQTHAYVQFATSLLCVESAGLQRVLTAAVVSPRSPGHVTRDVATAATAVVAAAHDNYYASHPRMRALLVLFVARAAATAASPAMYSDVATVVAQAAQTCLYLARTAVDARRDNNNTDNMGSGSSSVGNGGRSVRDSDTDALCALTLRLAVLAGNHAAARRGHTTATTYNNDNSNNSTAAVTTRGKSGGASVMRGMLHKACKVVTRGLAAAGGGVRRVRGGGGSGGLSAAVCRRSRVWRRAAVVQMDEFVQLTRHSPHAYMSRALAAAAAAAAKDDMISTRTTAAAATDVRGTTTRTVHEMLQLQRRQQKHRRQQDMRATRNNNNNNSSDCAAADAYVCRPLSLDVVHQFACYHALLDPRHDNAYTSYRDEDEKDDACAAGAHAQASLYVALAKLCPSSERMWRRSEQLFVQQQQQQQCEHGQHNVTRLPAILSTAVANNTAAVRTAPHTTTMATVDSLWQTGAPAALPVAAAYTTTTTTTTPSASAAAAAFVSTPWGAFTSGAPDDYVAQTSSGFGNNNNNSDGNNANDNTTTALPLLGGSAATGTAAAAAAAAPSASADPGVQSWWLTPQTTTQAAVAAATTSSNNNNNGRGTVDLLDELFAAPSP